eukprot:TRINITY_DN1469_c0_g1_i3.p1 TRINITY_DN1469_c0_g1~~TRINITY_DN1469_c0_g1_i3.p1  ORF type:complete len:121 (+),score=29.11 TRINITY_DN1469_c0_g1_i3:411-773(+)
MVWVSGTGGNVSDIGGEVNTTLTPKQETRQALVNLAALLEAAGSSMDRVVSVQMLLSDTEVYNECNTEYLRHFDREYLPSRSTALWGVPTNAVVAFSCVALPKDASETDTAATNSTFHVD